MTTEELLEKFYNQKPYFGFIALTDNKEFLRIQAAKDEQMTAIKEAESKGLKRIIYETELVCGKWWHKEFEYDSTSGKYFLNDEGESFQELRLKHRVRR